MSEAAGQEPFKDKEPAVFLHAIERRYHQGAAALEILKGAELAVWPGQSIALIAASGTGKSTLLHIAGLLEHPDAGEVYINGAATSTLSDAQRTRIRRTDIGFVYQFHHLLPELSAVENVMMPGLVQGRPKRELETRARSLLEEVGLKDRTLHRPGELSGGEQQRVALARALLLEPKLLLADEPTGNLDTATSAQIHDLFFGINKQRGTTIVVVTHNPALAASMPRVVTLRDGRVEKDERREEHPWRQNAQDPSATTA